MRYVEVCVGGGAVFFGLKGMTPFLRWVGGKRKLLSEVTKRLHLAGCPQRWDVATYEPACQCVSFDAFLIADVNPDLIAAYTAVRDDVEMVAHLIKSCPQNQSAYLKVRESQHTTLRQMAARAIWLNLHCHGGVWRTNARGLFNVPSQRDRFASVNLDTVAVQLREASKALQGVSIVYQDFSATLSQCGAGDVVYADPDYLPDDTSKFRAYTTSSESPMAKHECLAFAVCSAVQRGARVVISNSPAAAEIYRSLFVADNGVQCVIDTVSTQRNIGVGKGEAVKRRQDEILVTVSRL